MPGSEPYFLGYNKDSIFKWIIGIEGHLQKAKKLGTSPSDLACIIKHGADIEGHADEAVSHSLITDGESTSGQFAELSKQIHTFWKGIQKGETTPEQGIKQIRQIRGYFESFNPEYNISKCRSCGPVPEETLTFAKRLKGKNAYNISGETSTMAVSKKAVGMSYLLNWAGALVTKAINPWLDTNYPGALGGYNPSLAVDLLLGVGGPIAALKLKGKKREALATGLVGIGTYVSTDLWDQIAGIMSPTAGLRYVAVTPRGSVSVAAAVPTIPAQGALGKYT